MIWIEYLMLALMIGVGTYLAVYDIKSGIIPNKIVLPCIVAAAGIDILYFLLTSGERLQVFALNTALILVLLLCLYATKCFAGGDVKLGILLTLLYPPTCSVVYGDSQITLFFAICLGIFFGYCYLMVFAVYEIIAGKSKMSTEYVKRYLSNFIVSYLIAFIYIALINLLVILLSTFGIFVPQWITFILCFLVAWFSRRTKWMRNKFLLIAVVALDVVLSIWLKVVPFSVQPGTYVYAAVIILCQMTITASLYKQIPTETVKKGMILSTSSTVQMQPSRVRGLPGVSREDLRDRLTDEQAASVRRWGKTEKGSPVVTIMRKVPFAIFLVLGYAVYFLMWSFLK